MITCTATANPGFTIAPVPPRLFGSFVEHMGRAVYSGVFEPGHPDADEHGLRRDVLELVRELGVSVIRYPGGNFVSGYDWEDGIGPRENRPVRLDLAWHSVEPNTFGLNEFMTWTSRTGAEPMLAVNLGTRGVTEAVRMLEYTNHPSGTQYSDLRRSHGRQDPYDVKLWCLGNEMDGPWQIGHKDAHEYGRLAAETAKAMRMVDPTIELVACGSSTSQMPTFGSWERTVLEHAYDHVDYLSLHAYFRKSGDDLTGYLASADEMDDFIAGVAATCDHVAATRHAKRKIMLSFDEWNVEHRSYIPAEDNPGWTHAPRLVEDEYNAEDAVTIGNLLISLLRNSDRVTIACQAILVNVIAPIRTEPGGPAWRQTIFHPFALTARHARGQVLQVQRRCNTTLDSPTRGDVEPVDLIVTHDSDATFTVFAVNRSAEETAHLALTIETDEALEVIEHVVIDGLSRHHSTDPCGSGAPAASSANTMERRDLNVQLPPASWTMLRLSPPRKR